MFLRLSIEHNLELAKRSNASQKLWTGFKPLGRENISLSYHFVHEQSRIISSTRFNYAFPSHNKNVWSSVVLSAVSWIQVSSFRKALHLKELQMSKQKRIEFIPFYMWRTEKKNSLLPSFIFYDTSNMCSFHFDI